MRRALAGFCLLVSTTASAWAQHWRPGPARDWYAEQGWLVGTNYIPADAINQLEMWQAETFDPDRIDMELGWAESLGHEHHARVPARPAVAAGPRASRKRIDTFLTIAKKHQIRPIFVLFDSCWDPVPEARACSTRPPRRAQFRLGAEPGRAGADGPAQETRLLRLCEGRGAAPSPRTTASWPGTSGTSRTTPTIGSYEQPEPRNKVELVRALLAEGVRMGARRAPIQPLTSGVWNGDWSSPEQADPIEKIQIEQSDVISFHNYGRPEDFEKRIKWLQAGTGRLSAPSTWRAATAAPSRAILPIAKQHNVAAYQLGPGGGKDPDLPALGLLAAALHRPAAHGLVPRHLSTGRQALPPGRDRTDPHPRARKQGTEKEEVITRPGRPALGPRKLRKLPDCPGSFV